MQKGITETADSPLTEAAVDDDIVVSASVQRHYERHNGTYREAR